MSTIEERLQALEKTVELQNIAIGGLVTKATLEKLNEKNDKLFDTLIAHDRFTNEQLADVRAQLVEQDGKIVGMQTEMRQRFAEQDGKIVGLQTEMRQRFAEQDSKIASLDNKVASLQTTQAEHTTLLQQHTVLLQQILARLPEQKS